MKKIKVIICPAESKPYEAKIDNSLKELQRIVGGYIEAVRVAEDIVAIVNEEGILKGLPENRSVLISGLVGDLILCSFDYKGAMRSLSAKAESFLLEECLKRWNAQFG